MIGQGFLKQPFVLDAEGCVAVPQGPGLGVEIDDDGLREIMQREWSTQRG
jgi:galactonate dehydratase